MNEPLPESALERLLRDAEDLLREFDPAADLPERYRIVRELGRGGMGVVFEAEDRELGRSVAIKVLHPRHVGDEARERFVREARAAARLVHPGIATIYEAGDRFIAMRLVRGEPLSRLTPADRADSRRSARLVRDAALAVHAAHREGIIHRDVKPANVLVEGEHAIVTDFGLAKDLLSAADLSASGQLLGTPSYMAPEQAYGAGRAVDARTDVHGLGATLYFALTGSAPFQSSGSGEGGEAGGHEIAAVLRAVIDDEPRRPRAIDPTLPRDLERIVLRCLEKDPARRYETAAALADDLDRWLDGRPVEARPPSFGYRISRFVARRRGIVALGVSAGALALVLGVLAWNERAGRVASSAALRLSARFERVLVDAALQRARGEVAELRENLNAGLAECEEFLATNDVAEVHAMRGRLLAALDRELEARGELDRAIDMSPELAPARRARGSLILAGLSRAHRDQGFEERESFTPAERAELDLAREDLAFAAESDALTRVDHALAVAELARARGEVEAARSAYGAVRALDPTNADAILAQRDLELASDSPDAAFELAMSALDLHRGLGPAYVARAAKGEDPIGQIARRHALSAAEARVAGDDAPVPALEERAAARLALDDVDGAIADLSRALALEPSNALAYGERGFTAIRRAEDLVDRGEIRDAAATLDSAVLDFTTAVTLEPTLVGAINDRGIARLKRAVLLRRLGETVAADAELAAAVGDFDRAAILDSGFLLARLNRAIGRRAIAEVEVAAGRRGVELLEAASRDLDDVEAKRPGDPIVARERARIGALSARGAGGR